MKTARNSQRSKTNNKRCTGNLEPSPWWSCFVTFEHTKWCYSFAINFAMEGEQSKAYVIKSDTLYQGLWIWQAESWNKTHILKWFSSKTTWQNIKIRSYKTFVSYELFICHIVQYMYVLNTLLLSLESFWQGSDLKERHFNFMNNFLYVCLSWVHMSKTASTG